MKMKWTENAKENYIIEKHQGRMDFTTIGYELNKFAQIQST